MILNSCTNTVTEDLSKHYDNSSTSFRSPKSHDIKQRKYSNNDFISFRFEKYYIVEQKNNYIK